MKSELWVKHEEDRVTDSAVRYRYKVFFYILRSHLFLFARCCLLGSYHCLLLKRQTITFTNTIWHQVLCLLYVEMLIKAKSLRARRVYGRALVHTVKHTTVALVSEDGHVDYTFFQHAKQINTE